MMDNKKNVKTIIDYAETEFRTFDELPFNDVDSLVLSQLSYVHFNGLIGSAKEAGEPKALWELLKAEYYDSMFNTVLNGDKSKTLLIAMAASPRFRDIKVNYYEEHTDIKAEQQFSSVTYLLPFGVAYVAFRGTDTTLVGWKEDFNMAFMQEVPSQQLAVEQLKTVALLLDTPIVTGGHSKGGNLAIYAAAKCEADIQKRIQRVYSHDGPGFRKDIIKTSSFSDVYVKVRKTVPEFSMIGMLLQSDGDYKVVKSDEKFLMQHDPFSWQVGDGDFLYAKHINSRAYALNESISQWLESIDDVNRERFIDVLFNVIQSSGAKSVQEFEGEVYKNAMAALDAFKGVDADTRKFVLQTISSFAALSVRNLSALPKKRKLFGLRKTIDRKKIKRAKG